MANTDAPHGFRPVRHLTGGTVRTNVYNLVAANSAIGVGDVIVQTDTGEVNRGAADPTAGTVVGVAAEPKAASDGGDILVWDDPDIIYEAQMDDGTTYTVQTGMNLNYNIVDGTPVNGVSIQEIDEGSAATTSTLPLKALRLYKAVDNAFGQFNRIEVILNTHVARGVGTAGV